MLPTLLAVVFWSAYLSCRPFEILVDALYFVP